MEPEDTDEYLRNFVYPEKEAAEYMLERVIACFAIDALLADKPGAELADHHVHYTLLPEDVLIIEGVANLSAVEAGRYDVICTPIPYKNRDESQVRLLVRPQQTGPVPTLNTLGLPYAGIRSFDKVIVSCAVTGAIQIPTMSPHLPIGPDEIAAEAIAAAEAGASIVHVRDPETGEPITDLDFFSQVAS
jgi:hypothetical protein